MFPPHFVESPASQEVKDQKKEKILKNKIKQNEQTCINTLLSGSHLLFYLSAPLKTAMASWFPSLNIIIIIIIF